MQLRIRVSVTRGIKMLVRIKRGGVRFSAPVCSSFVPACVGKTQLGRIWMWVSFWTCTSFVCSWSPAFALRKRNRDPMGDQTLGYVRDGNEIAVAHLQDRNAWMCQLFSIRLNPEPVEYHSGLRCSLWHFLLQRWNIQHL